MNKNWLVIWNCTFFFHLLGLSDNFITPTDEVIFLRGFFFNHQISVSRQGRNLLILGSSVAKGEGAEAGPRTRGPRTDHHGHLPPSHPSKTQETVKLGQSYGGFPKMAEPDGGFIEKSENKMAWWLGETLFWEYAINGKWCENMYEYVGNYRLCGMLQCIL